MDRVAKLDRHLEGDDFSKYLGNRKQKRGVARMLNRWTGALAWAVVMLIVWTIFVPRVLSSAVFVWINALGVAGLVFAYALWTGTGQTRSITRLLHDIEAQPAAAASSAVDATSRG